MGRIQEEYGDQGISVVAINTAPFASLEDWRGFWRSKNAADVTWATDYDGQLVKQFNVISLGTTIIIDRQGRVSYRDDGATHYDTLRAKIEAAL